MRPFYIEYSETVYYTGIVFAETEEEARNLAIENCYLEDFNSECIDGYFHEIKEVNEKEYKHVPTFNKG